MTGTGAGLTATTGSGGHYSLYGVAGEVQIEVILEGFEKESRTIVVAEHTTADIALRPLTKPTDLNGDWRLTLSAAAACAPDVADDAATRSYDVTLAQSGTRLMMAVKPPAVSLITADARLSGVVIDQRVTIYMPVDDFYLASYGILYYSLVEMLGPDRFLAIGGTARGERVGAAVRGTLDGEFAVYRSISGGGTQGLQASCLRDDHGFLLERN